MVMWQGNRIRNLVGLVELEGVISTVVRNERSEVEESEHAQPRRLGNYTHGTSSQKAPISFTAPCFQEL